MTDLKIVAEPDPPGTEWMLDWMAGDLVYDVGANVGQTMLRLGDRRKVVAFEPCEESYAMLLDRLLPNAVASPVAVSDHDGYVELAVQTGHIARGQLTTPGGVEPPGDEHGWGRQVDTRTVEARTIDSLTSSFGVPDAIKVDVEGHEILVVAGAVAMLEKGVRPRWLIEFHAKHLLEDVQLLLEPYTTEQVVVRHPHYAEGSWGWANHGWLLAK